MMKKYGIGLLTVLLGLCLTGHAALVAHYTFDTEAGITNDVSGNGHDLTVISGYGTPGYTTNSIIGEGATVVNSGGAASDGWATDTGILTPSFTIALWVKPMGTSTMLVQPWSLTSGYDIYFGSTYRFATLSSEGMSYTVSSTAPSIGVWQHIALTYTATNGPDVNGTYTGVLTSYIDGKVDTTLEGAAYAAPSGNYMALGRRATQFFNGQLDDVYIYDTALSAIEIQNMAADGKPLVAHYTFDDSGNLGVDDSGNGHDLSVLYGAPDYTTNSIIGEGATVMNSGGIAADGWQTDTGIYTPSFTLALWVKPMGASSMVVRPYSFTTGGYDINIGSTYNFATVQNGGFLNTISGSAPVIGVWQHLAMTFTATNGPDANGLYSGVMAAYVDGSLVGAVDGAECPAPSSNFLAFGRRSSQFFNGLMDDVYIYQTALTPIEVNDLYVEGKGTLIAHYTFDDSENVGADNSGNGHDLSVYSGYGTPGYTNGPIGSGATVMNSGETTNEGWAVSGVLTPSFTFAAWVKSAKLVSDGGVVVVPSSTASGYEIYSYDYYTFATLAVSNQWTYDATTNAPLIGSWQHLALTYTPTNNPDVNGLYFGVMTEYIDGEIVGIVSNAVCSIASGNYLLLGRRTSKYFSGLMDDVYLYREALTQSEIQALYDLMPKGGYDEWAQGWGVDIGAATNDYDGDGLINLYEYGLGGDPTNALDRGTSPQYGIVDQGGTTYFGYVYPQLADANSGLTYSLETSTNLVSGTWTNAGTTVLGTNVTGNALNIVSNYTDTVDNQKFIRLMISTNAPAN